MMKHDFYRMNVIFFMLLCSINTWSQQMITISPDISKTQNISTLNGKASIVFVANSNDMVITSNIDKDPQSPKAVKSGNTYHYEMIIDISGGSNGRYFTITKYGTTNSCKTDKITLIPNKQLHFIIDQVENGIDIKQDQNVKSGWINKIERPEDKNKALIVFNSKIKLKIECPNLKHTIRSGRSEAGTYLDSLLFDVKQFSSSAKRVDSLQKDLDIAERRIKEESETMPDSTYKELQESIIPDLKDSVNVNDIKLAQFLLIKVSGDKTNTMILDHKQVAKMSQTGFLRYNIVILNETKVVVETQYGELLRQADSEFQDRQYARAAEIYRLAANEKGINAEQRNIALTKVTTSLRYDTIQTSAEKYAKLINDIVGKKQDVKKDLLIKAFDQAILAFRSLSNSTGDPYFKEKMEKLIAEKEKIGIILEGNTFYSELHQGLAEESPLGNCKFYGVKGSVSDDIRSNIYWKNDQELATSASDGSFKFQVKANQYDFIVVVGAHNGKIKANKVIPMKGRGDSKLKIVFGKK